MTGAFCLALGILLLGTVFALAECNHINPEWQYQNRKAKMRNIIEQIVCTSEEEAISTANKYGVKPYQLKSLPNRWLVDVNMTETEASLL